MTATATKSRIMFVDDEPAILAGLRNLLYKDRKRWDLVFALGGAAAMQELEKDRFDVVVSDMRMPQMDGATLLNHVRSQSPSTVRIMLSGHADREAIVRALPGLHQLLSKPCDAEVLRGILSNAISAIGTTVDPVMREIIGRVDAIPTTLVMRARLQNALDAAEPDTDELVAIAMGDPGIASKTLQLVNSAYFGAGRSVSTIEDAVMLLGAERMRYIAQSNAVFTTSDASTVTETQRISAARAVAVGARVRPEDRALASTAVLLAGIGPIALMQQNSTQVSEAEVASALIAIWGMPQSLVDLVRCQDSPETAPPELRHIAGAIHAVSKEIR